MSVVFEKTLSVFLRSAVVVLRCSSSFYLPSREYPAENKLSFIVVFAYDNYHAVAYMKIQSVLFRQITAKTVKLVFKFAEHTAVVLPRYYGRSAAVYGMPLLCTVKRVRLCFLYGYFKLMCFFVIAFQYNLVFFSCVHTLL